METKLFAISKTIYPGQPKRCSTMSWEKRGNKYYYYRKYRKNGKVLSEYIGGVEKALPILIQASLEQRNDKNRILVSKSTKKLESLISLDQVVKEPEQCAKLILQAAYVISGFHTHHRQWRKRNVKRNR